jgi:hypothetical protein
VTEPTPDREALETAKNLTGALQEIGGQVASLTAAVRRSRHLIIGLAVSLCIDVALTIVVAVFAVQAHDANASAIAAKDAAGVAAQDNKNLCLSSNVARAQQIKPWQDLLALSAPPRTAEQKHLIDLFLADLATIYAPRNCNHISSGNP